MIKKFQKNKIERSFCQKQINVTTFWGKKFELATFIKYQFPTKLYKLFLPSFNYLRYLCYMHILLGLWDMLDKSIWIYLV
jgi:hypothetical protein